MARGILPAAKWWRRPGGGRSEAGGASAGASPEDAGAESSLWAGNAGELNEMNRDVFAKGACCFLLVTAHLACSGGKGSGSTAGDTAGGTSGSTSGSGGSTGTGVTTSSSGVTIGSSGVTTGSGGASTSSATSSSGTSSGGGHDGGPAAIDYSHWELQLPSGSGTSPTTITPAQLEQGFSDAYFYPAAGGGQTFMDTATGITTSGSLHCRTEMREMSSSTVAAAWAPTGTNTLTVSGEVLQVGGGSSGKVTLGQVFNSTDSIPLCEFQYSTSAGGFQLLYEEAKGAGTTVDLMKPVALSTPYTFTLALSGNVLTVSVDGTAVYTHTPSAAVLANQFYFKFGNYDQTAVAGAVTTTPYTVVVVDGAAIVHQ